MVFLLNCIKKLVIGSVGFNNSNQKHSVFFLKSHNIYIMQIIVIDIIKSKILYILTAFIKPSLLKILLYAIFTLLLIES